MNIKRFDKKRREEDVWKEMETFIAVDDWWLGE